jgi:hypothetical protein
MWAPVLVETDPDGDHAHRVLLGLGAVPVDALLIQGPRAGCQRQSRIAFWECFSISNLGRFRYAD